MKKLAVAISVYDKFEDVKILVDIFRENWKGDYDICVCSSHPDAARHLSDCNIDKLLSIADIPFNPTVPSESGTPRMTMRVMDSIRKSCGYCSETQAGYTIHLHADGYPLSWDRLELLLERMRLERKYFAARGFGFGYYNQYEPVGHFDDMFFVFDNRFAREKSLWEFGLMDFLPHKISIHGFLAMLILARVGIKNFWHYGDERETAFWDGTMPWRLSTPMYFLPEYHFLHVNCGCFPHNLGQYLKASYLKRFGLTRGRAIGRFLESWRMEEASFREQLYQMENNLFTFFSGRGLHYLRSYWYGRDYGQIQSAVDHYHRLSFEGKLRWLWRSHLTQLKHVAKGWLKTYAWKRLGRFFDGWQHFDGVGSGRLDEIYHRKLQLCFPGIEETQGYSFDCSSRGKRLDNAPPSRVPLIGTHCDPTN